MPFDLKKFKEKIPDTDYLKINNQNFYLGMQFVNYQDMRTDLYPELKTHPYLISAIDDGSIALGINLKTHDYLWDFFLKSLENLEKFNERLILFSNLSLCPEDYHKKFKDCAEICLFKTRTQAIECFLVNKTILNLDNFIGIIKMNHRYSYFDKPPLKNSRFYFKGSEYFNTINYPGGITVASLIDTKHD